jgi:hypothetical protein
MSKEKVLSAKDISVIIRACKSAGVRKLSFNDLILEFGLETAISPKPNFIHYSTPELDLPGPLFGQKPHEEEDEINEDLRSIIDPVSYEQELLDGELEENQDG